MQQPREGEISEASFKADVELLDRFQSFSAELLRVDLLGIAVLGFFVEHGSERPNRDDIQLLLGLGAICFVISAGFALAHRYTSTDGLFYHLRSIRRRNAGQDGDALLDEDRRNAIYDRAGRFLHRAALLCGVGVTLVVGALCLLCSKI